MNEDGGVQFLGNFFHKKEHYTWNDVFPESFAGNYWTHLHFTLKLRTNQAMWTSKTSQLGCTLYSAHCTHHNSKMKQTKKINIGTKLKEKKIIICGKWNVWWYLEVPGIYKSMTIINHHDASPPFTLFDYMTGRYSNKL